MGSFLIQCCASQQAINEDAQCVVLPILQQRTYHAAEAQYIDRGGARAEKLYGVMHSCCDPESLWAAYSGFLSGRYADYGLVELDDTPGNYRILLDLFWRLRKSNVIVEEGENTSHDVPFDLARKMSEVAPEFDAACTAASTRSWYAEFKASVPFSELAALWAYLQDVVRENRVFALDSEGVPRPLEFAVLHRVAFNHLMSYSESQANYAGESLAREPLLKRLLARAREALETDGVVTGDPRSARFFAASQFVDGLREGGASAGWLVNREFLFKAAMLLVAGECTVEAFLELARPVLDARYVLQGMDAFNLKFAPIAYAGQDYANEAGKAYAAFVCATQQAVDKLNRARYGEDESEGE